MSELCAGGGNAAGSIQGCFYVRKGFALCPKVFTNPCKSILFIIQGFCWEDPWPVCTRPLRIGYRRRWKHLQLLDQCP